MKNIPLITPLELRKKLPLASRERQTIDQGRELIKKILTKRDKHLLIITGPCSIHDEKSALEYATGLAKLKKIVGDKIFLVMRVYFEKPRTLFGWKGFINDPLLDNSFNINQGLEKARKILLAINSLGVACATEFLNPIISVYLADLISYGVIGARTVESPIHRETASSLPMPVGFKNSTDGNLENSTAASVVAKCPHAFTNIDEGGRACLTKTTGNNYGHIILRGGRNRPNYYEKNLKLAGKLARQYKLSARVVIDCSHANSKKNYALQEKVFKYVLEKYLSGNYNIAGMMLESNLRAGRQAVARVKSRLRYGVSITDACIDWKTTESLIRLAYKKLK